MEDFPLPGMGEAVVAVPAPGEGPGWWAGAPCAALDDAGGFVLGYRVRNGHDGNDQTVVARSDDGETFTPVATLDEKDFGAMGMERPALARTDSGGWRLYVCSATPDSAHWWIDVLESDEPEGLGSAEPRTAFPGDEHFGVKDPVVQRADGGWRAWICCHLLEEKGEEDRMLSAYATSADGLDWEMAGVALAGRPGMWDARGARLDDRAAGRPRRLRRPCHAPRRTGSSRPAWRGSPELQERSPTTTRSRPPTCATSTCSRCPAGACASTTRLGFRTRATSCARS